RENTSITRIIYDALHISIHTPRQIGSIAGRDNGRIGVAAQDEGGQPPAHQLRLRVPRGHRDDQALDLQPDKRVQILAHYPMMPVQLNLWHRVLSEVEQMFTRPPTPEQLRCGLWRR